MKKVALCICLLLIFSTGCTQKYATLTEENKKLMQHEVVFYQEFLHLVKPLVALASDEERTFTVRYEKILEATSEEDFQRGYQAIIDQRQSILNLDDVDSEGVNVFSTSSWFNMKQLIAFVELEDNVAEKQKSSGESFENCIQSSLSEGVSQYSINHIEELLATYRVALADSEEL